MSHGTSRQKIVEAVLTGIAEAQQRYRTIASRSLDTLPEFVLSTSVAEAVHRLAQPCNVTIELRPDDEAPRANGRVARAGSRYGVTVRARAGDPVAAVEVHLPRGGAGSSARFEEDLTRLSAAIMYKPYKSKLAYGMVAVLLTAATPAALDRRTQAMIAEFEERQARAGIRKDYLVGEPRVDGDRTWQAVVFGLSRPAQGNQPPARLKARKA
jgi:hypothetical protein